MSLSEIVQFIKHLFVSKNGGTKMAKSKKPVIDEIDIYVEKLSGPTPDWPQGYSFEMKRGSKGLGKKLDFKNNKHPGFIVIFNILESDPSNPTGCQFLPDPNDAMWVQPSGLPDPPCPTDPAHWSQFRAIDVVRNDQDEENRALIVSNRNDYVQMFAFTLRFEIPGYPKVVEFDPIGNNQNGYQ